MGSVRELIPCTEVEVLFLDITTDEEVVKNAVMSHFGKAASTEEVQVYLTKKTFRVSLKAYVEQDTELAMRMHHT